MSTYTIINVNIKTGERNQIGSPMKNKGRAIFTAKLHAASGIFCEVHKSSPGVIDHCVYQSGTGK